ncbi:hypothetical protein GBAR_LOCUS19667 [Geodia barretti]|uniref:Uncharacterized protein n=1 Tax=Geodia barretti TaxID=519541 RepID=A0AA35WW54_GEOBA|nr:hypothetical protein GBAR_LOCUS19667 [Geodia barretti]
MQIGTGHRRHYPSGDRCHRQRSQQSARRRWGCGRRHPPRRRSQHHGRDTATLSARLSNGRRGRHRIRQVAGTMRHSYRRTSLGRRAESGEILAGKRVPAQSRSRRRPAMRQHRLPFAFNRRLCLPIATSRPHRIAHRGHLSAAAWPAGYGPIRPFRRPNIRGVCGRARRYPERKSLPIAAWCAIFARHLYTPLSTL